MNVTRVFSVPRRAAHITLVPANPPAPGIPVLIPVSRSRGLGVWVAWVVGSRVDRNSGATGSSCTRMYSARTRKCSIIRGWGVRRDVGKEGVGRDQQLCLGSRDARLGKCRGGENVGGIRDECRPTLFVLRLVLSSNARFFGWSDTHLFESAS